MKHIVKLLFIIVFSVSTIHAIMYKQWWAFAILIPIAVTLEWNNKLKARQHSKTPLTETDIL